jgi:hypothetical protein
MTRDGRQLVGQLRQPRDKAGLHHTLSQSVQGTVRSAERKSSGKWGEATTRKYSPSQIRTNSSSSAVVPLRRRPKAV